MARVLKLKQPYTYEDFCALVRDGEKADLIGGVIHMASPDNVDANDIFMWLGALMYEFAAYFNLGRVFGSRVACKLDEYNAPEPDILFVRKRRRRRILRGRVDGYPDLAVEIVSPDSVARDYVKKRDQYERFGVEEYWIIDETKRTATFLRRNKQGKFEEVRLRNNIFRSRVLKGFWLSLKWLWPESRPLMTQAFAQILRSIK